jgi:hypothetical protein
LKQTDITHALTRDLITENPGHARTHKKEKDFTPSPSPTNHYHRSLLLQLLPGLICTCFSDTFFIPPDTPKFILHHHSSIFLYCMHVSDFYYHTKNYKRRPDQMTRVHEACFRFFHHHRHQKLLSTPTLAPRDRSLRDDSASTGERSFPSFHTNWV